MLPTCYCIQRKGKHDDKIYRKHIRVVEKRRYARSYIAEHGQIHPRRIYTRYSLLEYSDYGYHRRGDHHKLDASVYKLFFSEYIYYQKVSRKESAIHKRGS